MTFITYQYCAALVGLAFKFMMDLLKKLHVCLIDKCTS